MTNFLTQRKTAAGLGIALVLVILLIFRSKISDVLDFSVHTINREPSANSDDEYVAPHSSQGLSQTENKEVGMTAVVSPYAGRDSEEVRPNPEEVKLFSEEQKNNLYNQIGNEGKAVKEDPQYFNGWIQLGLLKKVIGDYEGARDAWEYAGRIRPKNSISFANLGELYWRYLPDFPRSEANFNIALRNKPDDAGVYVSLSDLYFYSYAKKADHADDVLLDGLKANPENLTLMKHLASLYERQGNKKQALEWWEKVLAKDPSDTAVAAAIETLKKKAK